MAENAVATVLGGLFAQYAPTLTQISGIGPERRRVAIALGRQGVLDLRARMTALDGVAPGATASKTFGRVAASSELGGVRAVESLSLINRATTAGDVATIEHDVNNLSANTTFGANPPANLDGNPLGTR
jgi:hypothetical protein